jgi:hypothetical protein
MWRQGCIGAVTCVTYRCGGPKCGDKGVSVLLHVSHIAVETRVYRCCYMFHISLWRQGCIGAVTCVTYRCGDKGVSVLLHVSHIAVADQNFGTNRFCPLFPKSIHKRDYSTGWRTESSKHLGLGGRGGIVLRNVTA